jgi:hypothetical protein
MASKGEANLECEALWEKFVDDRQRPNRSAVRQPIVDEIDRPAIAEPLPPKSPVPQLSRTFAFPSRPNLKRVYRKCARNGYNRIDAFPLEEDLEAPRAPPRPLHRQSRIRVSNWLIAKRIV